MDFWDPVANPTGFMIFIVGISALIIGASFWYRSRWSKTILTGGMTDGTPSVAVITAMGQTGLIINRQPQLTFELQVQPPGGGAPYAARVKQTIPQMALGMLAPGRTVAVVISPKDRSKVKIDLQGSSDLGTVAAAGQHYGFSSQPSPMPGASFAPPAPPGATPTPAAGQLGTVRSNDELLAAGEPVAATVVAVQDTGQFYGPDPILILTVNVHAPTGEYQVQVGHRVPADRRPRLMPGTVLRAARDPQHPGALAIDWQTL